MRGDVNAIGTDAANVRTSTSSRLQQKLRRRAHKVFFHAFATTPKHPGRALRIPESPRKVIHVFEDQFTAPNAREKHKTPHPDFSPLRPRDFTIHHMNVP
jgi:hypothetical protein